MNPTMTEAMQRLGLSSKAELARFLEIPKQSMTGRDPDAELPDAWCWRLAKKRPDVFGPAPTADDSIADPAAA